MTGSCADFSADDDGRHEPGEVRLLAGNGVLDAHARLCRAALPQQLLVLRGASHPQELAEAALENGYTAPPSPTNARSPARCVPRAIRDLEAQAKAAADAAQKTGEPMPQTRALKLIIGSELQLTDADGEPFCTLIALATNRAGYGNLSELISLARSRERASEMSSDRLP